MLQPRWRLFLPPHARRVRLLADLRTHAGIARPNVQTLDAAGLPAQERLNGVQTAHHVRGRRPIRAARSLVARAELAVIRATRSVKTGPVLTGAIVTGAILAGAVVAGPIGRRRTTLFTARRTRRRSVKTRTGTAGFTRARASHVLGSIGAKIAAVCHHVLRQGVERAEASSWARICKAAARGSGADRMGRPTTSRPAPAAIASAPVAVRV